MLSHPSSQVGRMVAGSRLIDFEEDSETACVRVCVCGVQGMLTALYTPANSDVLWLRVSSMSSVAHRSVSMSYSFCLH